MVNFDNLEIAFKNFSKRKPFNYCIIDNFLDSKFAHKVANEFPKFNSAQYNGTYNNDIELKKTCNIWDRFLPNTYKLLTELNSPKFINHLSKLTSCLELYADPGLHGAGWHTHPTGGRLNPHLDYSIHPKLGLQRKFNLLIYLTPDWNEAWGGDFGLWDNTRTLKNTISPQFNRAVFFDTTQESWHGLATHVTCPNTVTRNSIAVYYLIEPMNNADTRTRALFAPTVEQKDNKTILDLIERRSKPSGTNVEEWVRK